MGHRVPTICNRLSINKGFDRVWYSDLHYNNLFYSDITLSKYTNYLILRYYKHKVRFLRGKHRRRRSTLRISGILTKRFFNKTVIHLLNFRQKKSILKYSLFIPLYKKIKTKKQSPKKYIRKYKSNTQKEGSLFFNLLKKEQRNLKKKLLINYTYSKILKKIYCLEF
jgi:hypothetical protein